MSPFLVMVLVALGLVGLISFQSLKERKVTGALLEQRQSALGKVESQLQEHVKAVQTKYEALKLVEEERDFLKKKISELERQAESTQESLRSTLRKKEKELQQISEEHRKVLDEVELLKGQLNQKEGEIVYVRTQLQEYAFARARKKAEQLTKENAEQQNKESKDANSVEEKTKVEEIKLADEAGIADRSRVKDDEELELRKESESLAVEKEMDERSKPTVVTGEEQSGEAHVNLKSGEELGVDEDKRKNQVKTDEEQAERGKIEGEKIEMVVKNETTQKNVQDEEADEQELADRRHENDDKDTSETARGQDEEERQDLDTDLMTDLRSDHVEEGTQQVDRGLE